MHARYLMKDAGIEELCESVEIRELLHVIFLRKLCDLLLEHSPVLRKIQVAEGRELRASWGGVR
jgi:hypothetical protein